MHKVFNDEEILDKSRTSMQFMHKINTGLIKMHLIMTTRPRYQLNRLGGFRASELLTNTLFLESSQRI